MMDLDDRLAAHHVALFPTDLPTGVVISRYERDGNVIIVDGEGGNIDWPVRIVNPPVIHNGVVDPTSVVRDILWRLTK